MVRIGRQHREPTIGNVRAVKVGRWPRKAQRGVARVTSGTWRSSRPVEAHAARGRSWRPEVGAPKSAACGLCLCLCLEQGVVVLRVGTVIARLGETLEHELPVDE